MFVLTGKDGRDGRKEKGQDNGGTGYVLGQLAGEHVHPNADGATYSQRRQIGGGQNPVQHGRLARRARHRLLPVQTSADRHVEIPSAAADACNSVRRTNTTDDNRCTVTPTPLPLDCDNKYYYGTKTR